MTIDDASKEEDDDEEAAAATCRPLATLSVSYDRTPIGPAFSVSKVVDDDSLRIPTASGSVVSLEEADSWTLALETATSVSQPNRARVQGWRRPIIITMVEIENDTWRLEASSFE
jgi:hypothetical protein